MEMQFRPLFDQPLQRPMRIAGPCSAESEAQVLHSPIGTRLNLKIALSKSR